MNDPLPGELDDLANRLIDLSPAEPDQILMTRLRAARPSRNPSLTDHAESIRPVSPPVFAPRLLARRHRWLAAAAAMVVLSAWGLSIAWKDRPLAVVRTGATVTAPAAVPAAATARGSVTPVAAPPAPPLFLPVDSAQRLVSLQPVPVTSGPDQAPRRVYRAVIMEDVAAVNAETDSVLIFSRPREVYLAAGNTVY